MESFLYVCKEIGISFEEMEVMDIGMCLDFIQEWVDAKRPENEKTRNATQSDFDNF